MQCVLDTNIFISALISPGGYAARALDLWLIKRYDMVTSQYQLNELRRVSRYARFKNRIRPTEMGTLINILQVKALVLDNLPYVDYSPDPDDNAILATALAGGAQYLVSGDKSDVLVLGKVDGTRILSARDFVNLLDD
ncbi:MAG: putative toxin-antitoxin system toxin component, PIN family [Deinococcota bacterium]